MIVIASIPGQLGNRLIVYASVMAWCIRNKQKLVNPSFAPYDAYFSMEDKHEVLVKKSFWNNYRRSYNTARISWRLKNSIPRMKCKWIDWHQEINLDDTEITKAFSKSGVLFLQGWKFRANQSLVQEKETIRSYFSLKPELQKQLDRFREKTGMTSEITIGVHIRRGDYAKFEAGKYFYENAIYLNSMLACKESYAHQNIHFMICSNEKVDLDFFSQKGLSVFEGPGHEALDMYALSECHRIIGPPSTYTMWASFLNDVPLFMIRDKNGVFDPKQTQIINTF
jgi:hypothetical protein